MRAGDLSSPGNAQTLQVYLPFDGVSRSLKVIRGPLEGLVVCCELGLSCLGHNSLPAFFMAGFLLACS